APPRLTAAAAVLVDAETGQVLYGRNAHQRRDPASTTKIMTAVLALEAGDEASLVEVSAAAAATPGSTLYLKAGERYRLGELVRGMMLASGNDAAVAIAEHVAGDLDSFVALMNAKARSIGLRHTSYRNPHGLTAAGHVTTAYDLALLTRYALRVPGFAALVGLQEGEVQGADRFGRPFSRRFANTNQLLFSYQWADGVKTGTTAAAGNCLVASATRGGRQLIAVVLHSADRWSDAARLLSYGFENFVPVVLTVRGAWVGDAAVPDGWPGRVPVVAAADVEVLVWRQALPRLRVVVNAAPSLRAPLEPGRPAGSVTVLLDGQPLARGALVTGAGAVRRTPLAVLRAAVMRGLGFRASG
ncbi:MAG: D-alanyl-D-alanine carboxypeptidase, partial [Clostridia bacterium]|nr:D-alanyl-D-alanine carboxypeptidase [Clostridia bacterium]